MQSEAERIAAGPVCADCGQPRAEHRTPLVPMGGLLWCPGDKIRTYTQEPDHAER